MLWSLPVRVKSRSKWFGYQIRKIRKKETPHLGKAQTVSVLMIKRKQIISGTPLIRALWWKEAREIHSGSWVKKKITRITSRRTLHIHQSSPMATTKIIHLKLSQARKMVLEDLKVSCYPTTFKFRADNLKSSRSSKALRRNKKNQCSWNQKRKAQSAKKTNPLTVVWLSQESQVSRMHRMMRMKALIRLSAS